ncbi:MAG: GNAT family N-acetyltransferase [Chitinophagales bacterium]
MTLKDAETAVNWAGDEGWNPGLDDAEYFYNSDPQGFFIGELLDRPIGSISAVAYSDAFGFMGYYIVRPEYRGKGYGIQLWKRAMDYMGNRVIGLDAVLAQEGNYQKSGFATVYHTFRFEGKSNDSYKDPKEIVELKTLDLNTLYAYDNLSFPASRSSFLKRWIQPTRGASLGYIDDKGLKGYGVIRTSRSGYRIGPLFADSNDIAEAIYRALITRIPSGSSVFIDIPEINIPALKLAERFNMQMGFETARMYRGIPIPIQLDKIYGVTSLELG